MPSRKTHFPVAVAIGALAAAARTNDKHGEFNLCVIVGGGVGASISAMWPDILEPALSPRHRKIAHSVATGTSIFKLAVDAITKWESYWRRIAIQATEHRGDPNKTPGERLMLLGVEVFASILVGLLVGLAAGYISHLVLDGFTPASLPLLGLS
ncbi:MAG: metal-dependent hydrolase [bacterium]